ncbi:hypothetical protein LCGC14_0578640 [marine sediment metagenome]|uniref:Uncharacterized protein n=1 Tax=marine sediment metagenome TaxID=412755 RepID=A0A0F9RM49_9ZZZZ|nr:hypothetical protein [bacterium]
MIIWKEGEYITYYLGNPSINCHIDAVHSINPKKDINTKELVIEIIKNTNCSGIYASISRTKMDLNRQINKTNKPAIIEYRKVIYSILNHLRIIDKNHNLTRLYLHLALHGMKDNAFKEIEVGTRNNETCSDEIFIWFRKKLEEISREVFKRDLKIVYNVKLKGNSSKVVHRNKYGTLFNTFQIEISKTLRTKYFGDVVGVFTRIITDFSQEINLGV